METNRGVGPLRFCASGGGRVVLGFLGFGRHGGLGGGGLLVEAVDSSLAWRAESWIGRFDGSSRREIGMTRRSSISNSAREGAIFDHRLKIHR